jgi:predicted N-acyltransferase
MQLTHDEFLEYIKKNGVTDARTTEDWKKIPEGTLIKFYLPYDKKFISSIKKDLEENNQYEYTFDTSWAESWKESYKGKFEVEVEKTLDNLEIGDVLVDCDNSEFKILGKLGLVYFISESDNFNFADDFLTIEQIKERFTIKQPKKTLELSLSEIANRLGVDEVKIK